MYSITDKYIKNLKEAVQKISENDTNDDTLEAEQRKASKLYKEYMDTIEYNPNILFRVPENLKDYEMCLKAIEKNGALLEAVPEKFKDYNMYLTAVTSAGGGSVLNEVPLKFRDYNMCLAAVKSGFGDLALKYTPKEVMDYDLCMTAVKAWPESIESVPDEFKDDRMYQATLESIASRSWLGKSIEIQDLIEKLPEDKLTYDFWLQLVSKNGKFIKIVPDKFRNYKMCLAAIKNDPDVINYLPEDLPIK